MMIRALAACALALAACSDNGPQSVTGSYALATVDGQALPIGGMTSGSLVLRDDSTYTLTTVHMIGSELIENPSGSTWTHDGGRLYFRVPGSTQTDFEAELEGNSLTADMANGEVWVFNRR